MEGMERVARQQDADKIHHVAQRLLDALWGPINLVGAIADCVILEHAATELRHKLEDAKDKSAEPTE